MKAHFIGFRELLIAILFVASGCGGDAAMFRAASGGDIKSMRSLPAEEENVNQREYEGETPLMYAAAAGQTEMALFLLERGADVNAVSKNGETALVRAGGHTATVKALLANGADLELGAPLISASYSGQLGTVKVLLEKGANPNAQLPDGDTALIAAAIQSASKDVVEALIAVGANVKHKNKQGKTAEMLAIENSHAELAALLKRVSEHKSR